MLFYYNYIFCKIFLYFNQVISMSYGNLGMDAENKEPIVGFRIGTYVQGKTCLAPIDNVSSIPQRMKTVVKVIIYF